MKKITFYIGCDVNGTPTYLFNEIGPSAEIVLKNFGQFANYTATTGRGFSAWGVEDVAVITCVVDASKFATDNSKLKAEHVRGGLTFLETVKAIQLELETRFQQDKVGVTVESLELADF